MTIPENRPLYPIFDLNAAKNFSKSLLTSAQDVEIVFLYNKFLHTRFRPLKIAGNFSTAIRFFDTDHQNFRPQDFKFQTSMYSSKIAMLSLSNTYHIFILNPQISQCFIQQSAAMPIPLICPNKSTNCFKFSTVFIKLSFHRRFIFNIS